MSEGLESPLILAGRNYRRHDLKVFLHAKAATAFSASLTIAILSVRLSVRLSHGWISQQWCKLGSPNRHLRLPGKL